MNLIFYTSEGSLQTAFTKYFLEKIAFRFPEVIVVSVRTKSPNSIGKKISNALKLLKKKKKFGVGYIFLNFFCHIP